MVLMRNKKNYPSIIIEYPLLSTALALFICILLYNTKLQTRLGSEDNPVIFFLTSQ